MTDPSTPSEPETGQEETSPAATPVTVPDASTTPVLPASPFPPAYSDRYRFENLKTAGSGRNG